MRARVLVLLLTVMAASAAFVPFQNRPAQPGPFPAPADVAAPPADATTTKSGLISKVITPGTGKKHPGPLSYLTLDYTGWTTQGQMFETSLTQPKPVKFQMDEVIVGWREGLELMVAGETRRLWIPGKLAYDGQPGKPQGTLVFDVHLIAF